MSIQALERELNSMRIELQGDQPTGIDRILVSTVLVAYLAFQRAAFASAFSHEEHLVRLAQEKSLDLSQGRLQRALKNLNLLANAKRRGARLPDKRQVLDIKPKSNQ